MAFVSNCHFSAVEQVECNGASEAEEKCFPNKGFLWDLGVFKGVFGVGFDHGSSSVFSFNLLFCHVVVAFILCL